MSHQGFTALDLVSEALEKIDTALGPVSEDSPTLIVSRAVLEDIEFKIRTAQALLKRA